MKAFLYCDKRSLNDATTYYVNILKRGLESNGYEWHVVHKISDINRPNVIVTITERYFFLAKVNFPKVKTIYWAQGIGAEEAKMATSGLKGSLRYYFRLFTERLAVNHSSILVCVSDKMKNFFIDSYGYKDNGNCLIMPCYNNSLSQEFNLSRYSQPTFVYAGGSSVWQGVDFMLEVFLKVQNLIPDSKLIICSGDKKTFEHKIKKLGIKNYEIKYVPVDKINQELSQYKYGFIIRDRHIVNEVATPTKMNTYLASYLIPIFSEAVDDFKKNINLGQYTLMGSLPLNADEFANSIVKFETSGIEYDGYQAAVKNIFNSHYNDEMYLNKLKSLIDNYI